MQPMFEPALPTLPDTHCWLSSHNQPGGVAGTLQVYFHHSAGSSSAMFHKPISDRAPISEFTQAKVLSTNIAQPAINSQTQTVTTPLRESQRELTAVSYSYTTIHSRIVHTLTVTRQLCRQPADQTHLTGWGGLGYACNLALLCETFISRYFP